MVALLLLLSGCRVEFGPPRASSDEKAEVWLYTSIYEEVIAELRPRWEAALPGLNVQVYQAGSEKVAQRFEAEEAAGGSPACLLATSDPQWYRDLASRGELLPFVPPAALKLDRRWVDPDGYFSTVRVSLMVLASNGEEPPASFKDLADPAFKDRFSTPDPLSSGTAFTAWSTLEAAYGEGWAQAVRGNGLVAAGGNSSVLSRMESAERPIGMILLENLLLKPDTVVKRQLPADGAIPVPGPLAIPARCPNPHAAERLYSWLFSDEAQAAIVAGGMHSPLPGAPAPAGAPGLSELSLFPDPGPVDGAAFKDRWAARMAEAP